MLPVLSGKGLRRGARRVFIAGTMDSAELDRRHVWHPFTQMREWSAGTPLVITEAEGAVLRDAQGREYLDGNSSIWTNLHGHRRAGMDAAIRE